jgi:hypothetical protein
MCALHLGTLGGAETPLTFVAAYASMKSSKAKTKTYKNKNFAPRGPKGCRSGQSKSAGSKRYNSLYLTSGFTASGTIL